MFTVDFTWLEYLLWLPRNVGMLLEESHRGFGNPEAVSTENRSAPWADAGMPPSKTNFGVKQEH